MRKRPFYSRRVNVISASKDRERKKEREYFIYNASNVFETGRSQPTKEEQTFFESKLDSI